VLGVSITKKQRYRAFEAVGFSPTWDFPTRPYFLGVKQSIPSMPAATWNRKNLPSDIEWAEQSPRGMEILRQLPSATLGLARRRPFVLILVAAGILGLFWYSSRHD